MNRRNVILLILSLALILAGCLMAWYTQTNGGAVRILDVRYVGTNGIPMSGLLYIPPNATADNPAPGILAIHGYINSRETQDGFAIEFARRGWVVFAADQTGHGYSGPPAFANGFGGPDALAYLRSLDIVDKNKVGLEGHSMGGWAVLSAASAYPDAYQALILEGSSTGTLGTAEGTPTYPRNLGLVYSRFDEFSQLMWGALNPADVVSTDKMETLFGTDQPVEVGQLYGSIADGTARKLYRPYVTHPGDHISTVAIGDAISWFQETLQSGANLPASNQIWYWKEIGTLIAFIGLILFFFPIGGMLLDTGFFRSLKEPLPAARPARGFGWWLGALLVTGIPAVLYFPLNHLSDATSIFAWTPTWLFSQNLTTGIMFWALGNALIGLILLLLWHFIFNKGASLRNYGVTWANGLHWGHIGKALLLAAIIAWLGNILLTWADYFFKVDFRFWIVALKLMSPLQFRIFLGYLVPFAVFFLVLGMELHGEMRRITPTGQPIKLWQAMLINVGLLIAGLVVLLLIQYIPLFLGGPLGFPAEPLLGIIAIQFVPILAIVALISTYYFRKTGHIYVGAFLNAIFVTWYIVAGQAIHYPF